MEALSDKKERELRAFDAACGAGLPIVAERIDADGEKPDLRVTTKEGLVGIELSEVMPLPRNPSFNSSLAEAIHHEDSVSLAERMYYAAPDAVPVKVTTYPWDINRRENNQAKMAQRLSRFVRERCREAKPVKSFNRLNAPEGFGVVSICSAPGPWFGGKSCNITFDGIYHQLSRRIEEKNKLLPQYRANLPNAPIWLLLYSSWEVSRGVPMPHGIRDLLVSSGFDRIFFIAQSSLEEIRRR